MKNTKILEMINNGQIEELKALLQDEVYQDSIKGNGDSKKRYAAMKRYIKAVTSWTNPRNETMHKPCKVEVLGTEYYSFIDGYSIALTTESIGELEEYDNPKSYFKVAEMVTFNGDMEKINVSSILAEAKSKGYKWKKSELGQNQDFKYMFKYKDGYFKIGLLDMAYSLIDNGEVAEIYYIKNNALLTIKTSVGITLILPVRIDNVNDKIVIDVEKNQEVA